MLSFAFLPTIGATHTLLESVQWWFVVAESSTQSNKKECERDREAQDDTVGRNGIPQRPGRSAAARVVAGSLWKTAVCSTEEIMDTQNIKSTVLTISDYDYQYR